MKCILGRYQYEFRTDFHRMLIDGYKLPVVTFLHTQLANRKTQLKPLQSYTSSIECSRMLKMVSKKEGRTYHASTVTFCYGIMQLAIHSFYFTRSGDGSGKSKEAIKSCISEVCIMAILNQLGRFITKRLTFKLYHLTFGFFLNLLLLGELVFHVGTGAKMHAEMVTFLMERAGGLELEHLLNHVSHYSLLPGIALSVFILCTHVCVYKMLLFGRLFPDGNGEKIRNWRLLGRRFGTNIVVPAVLLLGMWRFHGCPEFGSSRIFCETAYDRIRHIRHPLEKHPSRELSGPIKIMEASSLVKGATSPSVAKSFQKKNVVVIGLESIRASALSPYNSKLPDRMTPFLQSLADDGVLVKSAYASIAQTSKQLLSIFCGLEPNVKMTWSEWKTYPMKDCLPNLLKRDAGYNTAVFTSGKTDNGLSGPSTTTAKELGFDHSVGFDEIIRNQSTAKHFEQVSYLGYEDRAMLPHLEKWLHTQRPTVSPSMVGVFTVSSHSPYNTPQSFRAKHLSNDPRENKYLNTVRYVDSYLKELFNMFSANGFTKENTIFVIVGDHGQVFGKSKRYFHGSVDEESTHVPLLLYGAVESGNIEGVRRTVDIVPTVYEMLGLTVRNRSPLSTGKSLYGKGHDFAPAFDFFDEAALAMVTNDGYKVVAKVDEPVNKIQAVFRVGNFEHSILKKIGRSQRDAWSCQLLSWRQKVQSLARGSTEEVANSNAKNCGQGARPLTNKKRKLAANSVCGFCNNFGYKCTVKVEGAGTAVANGDYAEYPRKEPEGGVCMWSKKCNNANCILRYASDTKRWEIISTQSSNKVAYHFANEEKDPQKLGILQGSWTKGEIGANPVPTKVTFTCNSASQPASCNVCDHLKDPNCLSKGMEAAQTSFVSVLFLSLSVLAAYAMI
jgi:arylsulfatase A-like enzyme